MTQKRNALLFLTEILQEIEGIESYVALGKQKFLSDETIQRATFYRLQTIGEAVK
ncbi:MAG: HepT-like ribonuclease domain-containing protein [Cyanobacteria bacterium J06642_3]